MAPGVADLVNCVLLAAGCDQEVTVDDINDPDNCSSRLAELQGLYEDVRRANPESDTVVDAMLATHHRLPPHLSGEDDPIVSRTAGRLLRVAHQDSA